jgi:putative sigma-54 modulation protein
MELLVRNAEGNVPQRHRDYAAKKLSHLQKYFHKATKVEMVHHEQKGRHRLEVTVFADEFTIRGEERDTSLTACIDRVTHKLESRLRSLKGRLIDSHRRRGCKQMPPALAAEPSEPASPAPLQLDRKQFLAKPMSVEEAALQLELVGHPFYVFKDEATGQLAVLYRKKGRSYGLLEPEH